MLLSFFFRERNFAIVRPPYVVMTVEFHNIAQFFIDRKAANNEVWIVILGLRWMLGNQGQ